MSRPIRNAIWIMFRTRPGLRVSIPLSAIRLVLAAITCRWCCAASNSILDFGLWIDAHVAPHNPKSLIQKASVPLLETLQERLGITFDDQRLIRSALVHRSFIHEHPEQALGLTDNERLEFLGDGIVNYFAATLVFE